VGHVFEKWATWPETEKRSKQITDHLGDDLLHKAIVKEKLYKLSETDLEGRPDAQANDATPSCL
jgi:hypothetical protein